METAPVVAEPAGAVGSIETRALFDRDCDPIHLHLHRLSAGATLRFAGTPTDCLLYVWEGAIEAGGTRLGARSSAIVEYGTSLLVTACSEGAAVLGNRVYGPGTALAIAAHTKYGFFTGDGGLSFVNFRGTSPTYTSGDGAVVLDEAELWRSHVGKPEYLEIR